MNYIKEAMQYLYTKKESESQSNKEKSTFGKPAEYKNVNATSSCGPSK